MKKLFVFDLDGTLVYAYRAIWASLNHTRKMLGYGPVSQDTVRRSVGRGDVIFISDFFQPADRKKALALYRSHHRKSLTEYVKPAPWARWVLYSLKRRKKFTAVASNRPTPFTNIIVNKVDIKKYLDYVLCADKLEKIKPDPEILVRLMERFKVSREETLFVGDMDIDMLTAQRAGVEKVFVRGGSTSPGVIKKKFRKTKMITSLKEVMKLYG